MATLSNKYIFSGHESFPCKSLWLKKGYDFIVHGNNFSSPDAVIQLGVGKNMVSSIRYWLGVFGICDGDQPTWLGNYLFNENYGKDKYIEDMATLWLLHFNLVFLRKASLYNMLFCGLQKERSTFEKGIAITYARLKLAEVGKLSAYNESTMGKDVGVFLQNYALPRKPQSNEDYSSLLIDLDLIRSNSEGKGYYFNVDGKREVTKEIFLYGLLKLKELEGDNSLPFDTIQERIGLVFCMQNFETVEMLKQLANEYSHFFVYSDVAGIKQVQFIKDLDIKQVLDYYYGKDI